MHRRSFVRLLSAAPFVRSLPVPSDTPPLRVVSSYATAATPGMPGPYPGRVVSVKSDTCVDVSTGAAHDDIVREMMARGMRALTGASTTADAWRTFFEPSDIVGIKVSCGGHPHCVSAYEIVADVVRQLVGIGVPVSHIYVYERFQNQMDEVNYAPHLPDGVQIVAAERANRNVDNSGYDPATYLEADFFGEEDTRSNMMRLVSRRLTKIINIPNMKDHGAAGVTGCLKNIAYGSFSNVARTHQRGRSHTYSMVGTLAGIEPLRSRTVLPSLYWTQGIESRTKLEAAAIKRLCVAPEQVDTWRAAGFSASPIARADVGSRDALPTPGIVARAGIASPTRAPWIVANGWRFM